jgi:hypothetical protein
MAHICFRCKTRIQAVAGLPPQCPVCGGTKFAFESDKKRENKKDNENTIQVTGPEIPLSVLSEIPDSIPDTADISDNSQKEIKSDAAESIESINIIEPGRYNLNLLRLAESDDRVIQMGADGKYRLDLYSMMRHKKKR